MVPPSVAEEREALVAYSVGNDESMGGAVVRAFVAADVDVDDRETPLQAWIDADALEAIDWGTEPQTRLSTRIWDHPVVIEDGEVRIYPERDAT